MCRGLTLPSAPSRPRVLQNSTFPRFCSGGRGPSGQWGGLQETGVSVGSIKTFATIKFGLPSMLDCAAGLGIDIDAKVKQKMQHNRERTWRHGGKRV